MRVMLCAALTALMGLGLAGCDRRNGVDPDMLRIAQASERCDAAGNAITGGREDPAARQRLGMAAAEVCAPVGAAIRALSPPTDAGAAARFATAQRACAAFEDARMATYLTGAAADARLAATTEEVDVSDAQAATNRYMAARQACEAALGAPAYQLRRNAARAG